MVNGTTRISSTGSFFPTNIQGSSKIAFLDGSSALGIRVESLYAGVNYSSDGSAAGYIDVLNGYRVRGTTVIDASRALTNINSITSGAITSSGDITTAYNKTISMDYDGQGSYHKGISGLNQSTSTARGLHLFNYDNDSNEGIKFWVGTNSSRSQALHLASDTNATFAGTISSGAITSTGNISLNNAATYASLTLTGSQSSAISYSFSNAIPGVSNSGFSLRRAGSVNTLAFDASDNATFAGSISSGAITSSGTINGTYFVAGSGGVRVAGGGTYSDPGNQMYLHADASGYGYLAVYDLRVMTGLNNTRVESLRVDGSGNVNVTIGQFRIGNTVVVDPDRNFINMGNTSIRANVGEATFTWAGLTSSYPTIYGSNSDRFVMITFPHVPYLEHGQRGFLGTTRGSTIRFEGAISGGTHYDAGVVSRSGANQFSITSTSYNNPGLTVKQTSGNQCDVSVNSTTAAWSTASRSTLNINGTTGALLGFTIGGAGKAYLYAYGTTTELLSYGTLKLMAGANSAYHATLTTTEFDVGVTYLKGEGKEVFNFGDGYLRFNQTNTFGNGIWIGSSHFQGSSGTLSMGSNGTTSTARVQIISGTYDAVNVIKLNGANGYIYNKQLTTDGGHTTARNLIKYKHGGASSGQYNSNVVIWASEPGITYYGGGFGVNINDGGQYYGRADTNQPYGVYMRMNPANGYVEFWNTTSSSAPGGGTLRFWIQEDGDIVTSNGIFVGGAYRIAYNDGRLEGHYGQNWNESTPGHGKGTLHLDPNSASNNYGGAITFGASDSNNGTTAQAGIYTRSDGTYGTKMYLATTDSYGLGSRTAITISNSGYVVINRSSLEVSGNVTAYSDERLKDNIKTLDGSKALKMRGVSFTKDGKEGSGVIAQELELVAPELVHTSDDEMGTKSVAYGNLVGYLIENAKQQQAEINELKTLIKKLMEK